MKKRSDHVRLGLANQAGWLVVDRPDKRNAMTYDSWRAIPELVAVAEADDEMRAIVLTGEGASFCVGADIDEMVSTFDAPGARRKYEAAINEAVVALATTPKPTIAAITGHCIGGGCALAVACDMRIATFSATFAIPAARLDVVYDATATGLLVALVGPARTKYLLLRGVSLDAAAALAAGLVELVCAEADLTNVVNEAVAGVAAGTPRALAGNKGVINEAAGLPPVAGVDASASPHQMLDRMRQSGRGSRSAP